MKFDLRLFISYPILMTIAACAPTAEKPVDDAAAKEADVQKIHDLREEFLVLNRAKDAAGIANLHAHDIVQMIPNSESVVGRDALTFLMFINPGFSWENSRQTPIIGSR